MKILFVSAVLPFPLYSGGQVRIYHFLKALATKHEITLFCFIRDLSEIKYLSDLKFCRKVITVQRGHAWKAKYLFKTAFGKYPLLLNTYENALMRAKIKAEINSTKYDLIHLEPSYVWPCLPILNLPTVVCEHNLEDAVYQAYANHSPLFFLRPFFKIDIAKLKFWEKFIWQKAQRIVAVSKDDAAVIETTVGKEKVDVIENGVDLSRFKYLPKKIEKKSPVFLYVGYFGWMQNRDAVGYLLEKLWPRLLNIYPDAKLHLVGRKAPKAFFANQVARNISVFENVVDIEKIYHQADILLAPIRVGGGTNFKILEAMSCGLPIITTVMGARGLRVRDGKDLIIADDAEAQLSAVEKLINDDSLYRSLQKNARSVIEQNYGWDKIARKLNDVWETYAKHN